MRIIIIILMLSTSLLASCAKEEKPKVEVIQEKQIDL